MFSKNMRKIYFDHFQKDGKNPFRGRIRSFSGVVFEKNTRLTFFWNCLKHQIYSTIWGPYIFDRMSCLEMLNFGSLIFEMGPLL